ncbi:ALPL-like protein [Mya arenaria]|uniref:ALPL-like protein n=1 Tax=Mya arenaria TaxID=6604 RepID=A0ABY7DXL4_MYAAR|nr:ALPL-like protein [Mya arenaria]
MAKKKYTLSMKKHRNFNARENGKILYRETFTSYNVHALIHIADDVEHFGTSLYKISAFLLENHLHKLKKRYPSNQMQEVCDRKLQQLDTYTGWPGSVHDARVFKNSPLQDACQQLHGQYHSIGDSAFSLSRYMLVPYRDKSHLHAQPKKFNKAHSSTIVEKP